MYFINPHISKFATSPKVIIKTLTIFPLKQRTKYIKEKIMTVPKKSLLLVLLYPGLLPSQ